MIKKQSGFTLVELISLVFFLFVLCAGGYLLYMFLFELIPAAVGYLKANS